MKMKTKTIKGIMTILTAVILVGIIPLSSTACDKNDKNPFVGTWSWEGGTLDGMVTQTYTYVFTEKTFTYGGGFIGGEIATIEGTYTRDGNTATLFIDNEEYMTVEISGKTLTWVGYEETYGVPGLSFTKQ